MQLIQISQFVSMAVLIVTLVSCASPPQSEIRCPPKAYEAYSPEWQRNLANGLRALRSLVAINERDIDLLSREVRDPIKTLYQSEPVLRQAVEDLGSIRASCRALTR